MTGLTPIFLKSGERDVLNCIMQGMATSQIANKSICRKHVLKIENVDCSIASKSEAQKS